MACTAGSSPSAPFDTLSSTPFFDSIGAGYNFVLKGVGTRDLDTNSTPASIILNVPGTVLNAYLYVNTLDENPGTLASVDLDVNGGGFTSVTSAPPYNFGMIGWTNDSCWLSDDDGSHMDGASSDNQNIYNHVFWADVTTLVLTGTNTYLFMLPGITRGAGTASLSSDNAYYPGCQGSQGIVLFVVYDDGSGTTRNVKIFQGAKLLEPSGTFGGSTSHTVTFSAGDYLGSPKVAVGVGDAQTKYSDSFCFNGTSCIPQNIYGSAINPTPDGNLLETFTLLDVCALTTGNQAVMSVVGGVECICWFLFAYCADYALCSEPGAPTGSLSVFKNLTGNYDYVTGGVGTRDQDIDVVPGVFSVLVPGTPLEAYLYWNVIVDDTVDASNAILNLNTKAGTLIGKVGNTCWSNPNFCQIDDTLYDPGIKNQVWRADVTADVTGDIPTGGIYNASVTIPNVHTDMPVQLPCDLTNFPGCSGSQGIVLLVIYESTCDTIKRVLIYDGAVQLVGATNIPVYGGVDDYVLPLETIETEFTGCGRITLGIGDAQCSWADEFLWNGSPLPSSCLCPNPSYASPNVGNLLWLEDHLVQVDELNTIEGTTDDDCLCWFLFGVTIYPKICLPNDCGENECHAAAPFDQLYRFNRMVGDIDFVLAGVGIRDFDTNITPAEINITVPGTVIKAYLYWNTIGGGDYCPNSAIFNGMPVSGDIIGCCGNTCWSAYCAVNGSDHGDETENNNLLNKVWFHNVTSLVPGTGVYTISIPGQTRGPFQAYSASDSPYYPGCCGGQGIALLVIYRTAPQVVTRPLHKCPPKGQAGCVPDGNKMVTETETREIIIWHGAKLLKCDPCQPATIGGSNSYTIPWKTKYTWHPKIATAVGDAQSQYADSFSFNGILLPPQPSYFNPYPAGNLLHVKTEYLPGHITKCDCGPNSPPNTVRAFTPDDCLCWFLFVWSGSIKCTTPVISSSMSFSSPPTPMMALWNPNPPDCCPVRLPCCGNICLPAKLNIGITAQSLSCSCFATQGYTMNWNKAQQKYIMQNTSICGCTLSGSLSCVGNQWVLYLALSSGSTICSQGTNSNFPINCSPFGGAGGLFLEPVDLCDCDCVTDLLVVNISTG